MGLIPCYFPRIRSGLCPLCWILYPTVHAQLLGKYSPKSDAQFFSVVILIKSYNISFFIDSLIEFMSFNISRDIKQAEKQIPNGYTRLQNYVLNQRNNQLQRNRSWSLLQGIWSYTTMVSKLYCLSFSIISAFNHVFALKKIQK